MKVLLIALICATSILGCNHQKERVLTQSEKAARWIHYYKDPRTNICFAGSPESAAFKSFTVVPCSSDVLALIENWPEFPYSYE